MEDYRIARTGIFRIAALLLAIVVGLAVSTGTQAGEDADQKHLHVWRAGLYSFSDELGGFSIIDVRGKGTFNDPAIITQDIKSVAKSILTVRLLPVKKGATGFHSSWTTLHLRLNTLNRSPASWIGYGIELQEELGKPSIYGDGLSFNQLTRDESNILSDRFARYEIEHEPGDRLVFNDGWVDQLETVRFSMFLLDLTPSAVFYIEQIPHLPAS